MDAETVTPAEREALEVELFAYSAAANHFAANIRYIAKHDLRRSNYEHAHDKAIEEIRENIKGRDAAKVKAAALRAILKLEKNDNDLPF